MILTKNRIFADDEWSSIRRTILNLLRQMKKSRGRFVLLYIIIGVNLLVGCGRKTAPRYVIGVSQCSEDIWRDKFNKELQMAEYLNDSIQVKLASSNDDSKLQTRQINQIDRKSVV